MKAVILAGGKGTRLKPITDNINKPLVDIKGRPCLDYIVDNLRLHGIKDIMLSLWWKPKALADYAVKNGLMFYVQEEDLDTAGAIKVLDWWLSDPFIVCNGDTITNVNITEMLEMYSHSKNSLATIFSPITNEIKHNGGTYIFAKSALDLIPEKTAFSLHKDLLPKLFEVDVYPYGFYYDIGTLEKLKRLETY